jgi:hypothetical protein
MNKTLVIAGIGVAVISKVIVLKSILIDAPVYQRCMSEGPNVAHACGIDPFIYFIFGWFITVAGFILIVFGLRLPGAARRISR